MSNAVVAALVQWSHGQADRFGLPSGGHNDQRDAFRHALISAELTRLFGPYIAKTAMDEYENQNPNDPLERRMDESNNAIGREIGYNSTLLTDIPSAINDALNDGRLVEGLDDPRINDDIDEPYIPDDPNYPEVSPIVADPYKQALNWQPRRDPLTFDLDGDGLETVGVSSTNPILFDHDGDGISNGTGWVSSDDAFLVLDKNGNGTIDNGNELFGDNTVKANGQKATDGFDALADLDSNADGVVNAQDTAFSSLKLWRDINQDGISQSNELFTLDSQNIASINVGKTANSQILPNGNQIADTGSYTKLDGSTGTLGEVTGDMADINLAEDTFHRTFPDTLDTTTVATLPDMQGSGKVRDLREAATQSATLQNLLTQYAAATTRSEQMALIDQLLDAWADTGGLQESYDDRLDGIEYTTTTGSQVPYYAYYEAFGDIKRTYADGTTVNSSGNTGGGTVSFIGKDLDNPDLSASYKQTIAAWHQKIHILESFNGSYFFGLPTTPNEGAKSGIDFEQANDLGGAVMVAASIKINFNQSQLDLLQQSYDALKVSVYKSLSLQTRFNPLLDQITLVIDASGIKLDFTQVMSNFEQKINSNPEAGLIELIDFNFATKDMLMGTGWQGWERMAEMMEMPAYSLQNPAIVEVLKLYSATTTDQVTFFSENDTSGHVVVRNDADNNIFGGVADDVLIGLAGNDVLKGGKGADHLIGGSGDDALWAHDTYNSYQETTTDILEGGTGNDALYGTAGANTYIYNLGDGVDTIYPNGTYALLEAKPLDRLVLGAGISPQGVTLSRVGTSSTGDLVISFANNSSDQIIVKDWFNQISVSNRLATIEFADGTVWTQDSPELHTINGTDSDDVIYGDSSALFTTNADGVQTAEIPIRNEVLNGLGGNDVIYGKNGTDTINGGDGNDVIWAFDSNGSYQERTNDVLVGGKGNDMLYGTAGDNTYIYNKGDGADTIYAIGEYTLYETYKDKIVLGADIAQQDVTFSRSGSDMLVNFANAGDQITIKWWFGNDMSNRMSLQFADGTLWQPNTEAMLKLQGTNGDDEIHGDNTPGWQLDAAGNPVQPIYMANNEKLYGLDGNDTIYGYEGTDTLIGGSGDDVLYGDYASGSVTAQTNDIFEGGTGNDTLYGTAGANTYIYNLGDGADTIYSIGGYGLYQGPKDTLKLGAGISEADIKLSRTGNDMVLNFTNAGDKVTIKDWFDYSLGNRVNVQFANGTIWQPNTAQMLTLNGTNGDDVINGDNVYDTRWTEDGTNLVSTQVINHDTIYGFEGNDTLTSYEGDDTLDGGVGDDTMIGGSGNDTYKVDSFGDVLVENADEGNDTADVVFNNGGDAITLDLHNGFFTNIENLRVSGTGLYDLIGNAANNILEGNESNNYLAGNDGNDILNGGTGDDTMVGGYGDDTYMVDSYGDVLTENANEGNDTAQVVFNNTGGAIALDLSNGFFANIENLTILGSGLYDLFGNAESNWLKGNNSANYIADMAGGNNVIQGLAGSDTLNTTYGNNVLDGGANDDVMTAGDGNDLLIGSAGNDTITTGAGYDVIAFNRGDGQDVINASTSADNTISLGGSFAYSDLSLTKSTNDLIIKMGASDQITLKDWYLGSTNKSVVNLQVIAEAMQNFNQGGSDALRDNKVESFNFASLVSAFDTDVAANAANATNWQLTDARLTAHLQSGSDTEAIGGDLAYQYGKNNTLTGMGLLNAQSVIGAANFGQTAQAINDPTVWQAEANKLA